MKVKKKLNVFLFLAVTLFLTIVFGGRTLKATEKASSLNVSSVTFEYMDAPYTGESCNYPVEDNKIIIKDIYSKICIDRPEDKIRIHSIDFRNISTKLYEGQDTNTLHAWKGYEETPIYINGNQKVEKGSVLDKNLKWGLWWVKLD